MWSALLAVAGLIIGALGVLWTRLQKSFITGRAVLEYDAQHGWVIRLRLTNRGMGTPRAELKDLRTAYEDAPNDKDRDYHHPANIVNFVPRVQQLPAEDKSEDWLIDGAEVVKARTVDARSHSYVYVSVRWGVKRRFPVRIDNSDPRLLHEVWRVNPGLPSVDQVLGQDWRSRRGVAHRRRR